MTPDDVNLWADLDSEPFSYDDVPRVVAERELVSLLVELRLKNELSARSVTTIAFLGYGRGSIWGCGEVGSQARLATW